MEIILLFASIVLLTGGLIGQGFEMRKIRNSVRVDEELNSKNVFTDKRNFKWYVIIAAGVILWYVANQTSA